MISFTFTAYLQNYAGNCHFYHFFWGWSGGIEVGSMMDLGSWRDLTSLRSSCLLALWKSGNQRESQMRYLLLNGNSLKTRLGCRSVLLWSLRCWRDLTSLRSSCLSAPRGRFQKQCNRALWAHSCFVLLFHLQAAATNTKQQTPSDWMASALLLSCWRGLNSWPLPYQLFEKAL